MGKAEFFRFPARMELKTSFVDLLDDDVDEGMFYSKGFLSKARMNKPWPTEITCGAFRGRPRQGGGYQQCLEPRSSIFTNNLTTVQKDNVVIYPKEG